MAAGSAYALREASTLLDSICELLASQSHSVLDRCSEQLTRAAGLLDTVVTQLRNEPKDASTRARAEEVFRKAAQVRLMLEFGADYCHRRIRQIASSRGGYDELGRSTDIDYGQRVVVRA